MKKFWFYTTIVLFTITLCCYTLFLVVQAQVNQRFGFVESTSGYQFVFENITFHKVRFSKVNYITFIFESDRNTQLMGKKSDGQKVHLCWNLCGRRLWYERMDQSYSSRKWNWFSDKLVQQKLKASLK